MNTKEKDIMQEIYEKVTKLNDDNITRTNAYQAFYFAHPEIEWAFLASMVSRNTGYFMTDLQKPLYKTAFSKTYRTNIFLTYEKGNWLIFKDAYPQLLLYEYSKKTSTPHFHLLPRFHVSTFMEKEWLQFWKQQDIKRLMTALIINEQNMLEQHVIQNEYFQTNVFQTLPYKLEQTARASTVLFPTKQEKLYGSTVTNFLQLKKRIELGIKLSNILFTPSLQPAFEAYAKETTHTASRTDYSNYYREIFEPESRELHANYETIQHKEQLFEDWYQGETDLLEKYKVKKKLPNNILTGYVRKKRFIEQTLSIGGEMRRFFKF